MANRKRKTNKKTKGRSRRPQARSSQAGNQLITTRVITRVPPAPKGLMDTSFYERVCSQINPFCAEALGAKIYDLSSAKTLTSCVRKIFDITTDTDGRAFYMFLGNLVITGTKGTIDPAGDTILSFTGLGAVPMYAEYLANAKRYRVVSFGCRFVPTIAALENSGAVIATEVDFSPATGTQYNSVNLSPVNIVRSLPGDPLFWISRPTDMEYTAFETIDASVGNQRTALALAITGGQSNSTVGIVEYVMNIELVPTSNSIGGLFPTSASPAVPAIMNTASNVMRDMKPLHSGTQESLTQSIMEEVKTVGSTLVKTGGNYLRNSIMAALLVP